MCLVSLKGEKVSLARGTLHTQRAKASHLNASSQKCFCFSFTGWKTAAKILLIDHAYHNKPLFQSLDFIFSHEDVQFICATTALRDKKMVFIS